jgi:hypothetical protein
VRAGVRRGGGGRGPAIRQRPRCPGHRDRRARRRLPRHGGRCGGRVRRPAVAALAVPDRLGDPGPGLRRRSLAGARAAGGGVRGRDRAGRGAGGPP